MSRAKRGISIADDGRNFYMRLSRRKSRALVSVSFRKNARDLSAAAVILTTNSGVVVRRYYFRKLYGAYAFTNSRVYGHFSENAYETVVPIITETEFERSYRKFRRRGIFF